MPNGDQIRAIFPVSMLLQLAGTVIAGAVAFGYLQSNENDNAERIKLMETQVQLMSGQITQIQLDMSRLQDDMRYMKENYERKQ